MKDTLPKGLFPFGLQQMPGGHPGRPGGGGAAFSDLFYSMGVPGVWSKGAGGTQYRSVFQDMMNQNLQAGQPPFTGFPEGFGQGDETGVDTGVDEEEEKKRNPLKGMPKWYQDWYYSSGNKGGVPRSKGLLDV